MEGNLQYFEDQVRAYLTADPKIFVSAQYELPLGSGEEIQRWPDILAVDFNSSPGIMHLVEISTATRVRSLEKRLVWYLDNYEHVGRRIRERSGMPFDALRFWIFVRSEAAAKLPGRIVDDPRVRIADIEAAAFPWKYLQFRLAGQEPPAAKFPSGGEKPS